MDRTEMGRRIRASRQAANLSINALADRCGVSERTIIRWENGDNIPAGRYLATLAQALEVSPLWLLGDGNDSPVETAA